MNVLSAQANRSSHIVDVRSLLENQARTVVRDESLMPSAFRLESFSRESYSSGFATTAAQYADSSAFAHFYAVAHLAVKFHEVIIH
jgi:hypothetical protein